MPAASFRTRPSRARDIRGPEPLHQQSDHAFGNLNLVVADLVELLAPYAQQLALLERHRRYHYSRRLVEHGHRLSEPAQEQRVAQGPAEHDDGGSRQQMQEQERALASLSRSDVESGCERVSE